MSRITLMPAYGHRYENRREIISDWNAGVDFKILNGPYCSKRDFEAMKNDGADMIEFVWLAKGGTLPKNMVYWRSEMARVVPTNYLDLPRGPLNDLI